MSFTDSVRRRGQRGGQLAPDMVGAGLSKEVPGSTIFETAPLSSGHISPERSLEELVMDVRALSDRVVAGRNMSIDHGVEVERSRVRLNSLIASQIVEPLKVEIRDILDKASERQRAELIEVLQLHMKHVQATTGRADRMLKELDVPRHGNDSLTHGLIERLDWIAARQEDLEALLYRRNRSIVPGWVAVLLAAIAVAIAAGLALKFHFGIHV